MAKPDTRDPLVKALEAIAGRMIADMPDHPAAQQMQGEVNRLRMTAEALDNLNRSRSPLDTPAAHALKVGKRAKTFNSEVTQSVNRAAAVWAIARTNAEKRIEEKVNLKPDAFAGEIRTAFRALPSKKQIDLLGQWVADNKGPEMAAIVRAPSFLSGISDEMKANFEQALVHKHAAAEIDEIAKLDDVYEAVSAATRAAGNFAVGLTDPGNLAKIEREAAESDAADAAFSQSLQPPQ